MNNIVPYLWQSSEPSPHPHNSIKIVDTIIKEKSNLQWYFFSEKQNKILRKKKENSTPAHIIEGIEKTQNQKLEGIYVGVMWRFNPFRQRMVSAPELVEEMYDEEKEFIFYNLMQMKSPELFIASYSEGEIYVRPYSHQYQLIPLIQSKIEEFLKVLEGMISAATLQKSSKIVRAELLVCYSSKQVYLVCADVFKINNDYYHLSYQYSQQQPLKEPANVLTLECETCSKLAPIEDMKEINYQGAVFLRTTNNKSKYGLSPTRFYKVCEGCISILNTHYL